MALSVAKKVGLAVTVAGSVTGIVKVAIDSSSGGSVVPVATNSTEALVLPEERIDSLGSESNLARSRRKRETQGYANYVAEGTQENAQHAGEEAQSFIQTDSPITEQWKPEDRVKKVLSEEEKIKVRKEAKKIYETLNDYTFKIFGPCVYGTGWILDYQLSRKGDNYPTTWYLATNAHVIRNFRFSENPYKQLLPIDDEITRTMRKQVDYEGKLRKHNEEITLDYRGSNCNSPWEYGYFDMNIAQQDYWDVNKARKADRGLVAQKKIKEPKLFFSAIDFLEENPNKDTGYGHYADFAVLEIEFYNQDDAKMVTGGFADRYGVDSTNVINVFNKPLETKYKYNKEALNRLEDNIYILAYPQREDNNKWKYTKNFNENTAIASRLDGETYEERKSRYRNGFRGFVNAKNKKSWSDRQFYWGNKEYKEFGHYYKIQHNPLDVGSSGGLFVDKDLGALAMTAVTTVGPGAFSSWILPLRSEGVSFRDGVWDIVTPEYDLILGAKGQKSSYRQQVNEYVIKKGKRTWLSAKNWRHRDHDDQSWIFDDSYSDF